MKRILYGISGIGNGHANREMPIIEELSKDCQIMIFAHDDSLRVMQQKFGENKNITIVPVGIVFVVGDNQGLDFGTTANLPANLDSEVFRKSYQALDKVAKEWGKVDLVITDYEPLSAQYAYANKIPLVTIDQQSKFLYGDLPKELGGFTFEDEIKRLQMFFPKVDTRIVCSFFSVDRRPEAEDIMLVPSTIKNTIQGLKDHRQVDGVNKNILIYISSAREFVQTPESVFEALASQPEVNFYLFVPKSEHETYQKLGLPNCKVYPHGTDFFIKTLQFADGIISTAGHSLLSEAMYLGIPVYAIPVFPYEQHLNAYAISTNGFGCQDRDINTLKLAEFCQNLSKYTENISTDKVKLQRGVGQQIIVDYLRKKYLTDKQKILVFTPPFYGHFNVLKEMIRDLQDSFEFSLCVTGWKNIKIDTTDLNGIKICTVEAEDLRETDPALWTLPRAVECLDRVLEFVDEIRPDLIIYDFFSIEGHLAGKLRNIESWGSIPALIGKFENQDYRDDKLNSQMNQVAIESLKNNYNLVLENGDFEMVSDGVHLPGATDLVWSNPEITPSNFRVGRKNRPIVFVGNPRGDNRQKTDFKNKKPLIYFSFGTVVMNNLWNLQKDTRERMREFIGELARLWEARDLQIVFVTQGKEVLARYPKNWWVYDQVDQVEILSRADVFITHGGNNGFHESVMQRVPMIVVPFFGDQLLVAERIEELCLGIKVGGSRSIDTHEQKSFLNKELAQKIVEEVDKVLNANEYARNFLSLTLTQYNLKKLIEGHIDAGEFDLVEGFEDLQTDLPLDKWATRYGKKYEFYQRLTRVHKRADYKLINKRWIPIAQSTEDEVAKNTVKPLVNEIIVASKSELKLAAVETALKSIDLNDCLIRGVECKLGHKEQLVGLDEIVRAVFERYDQIVTLYPPQAGRGYLSIVSGIIPMGGNFLDISLVLAGDSRGRLSIFKTPGLELPQTSIYTASSRGFDKYTVSKVLGEESADHTFDTDPHKLITKGKESRQNLIASAIGKALAIF